MNKRRISRTLIISAFLIMQCAIALASPEASQDFDLQGFLGGYVTKAGQLVCIFGAIEICMSIASNSSEKRYKGLQIFGTGIVLTCVSSVIQAILN